MEHTTTTDITALEAEIAVLDEIERDQYAMADALGLLLDPSVDDLVLIK